MFTNIFEGRNKRISSLIQLGDHIGRSLRENVEYFSSKGDYVIYLTESGNVIKGKASISDKRLTLEEIQVEPAEVFSDPERHDEFVSKQVGSLIHKIFEDRFSDAKSQFNNLLDIWESRIKFKKVSESLEEKSSKFGPSQNIVKEGSFERLLEITPDLVKFLKENKDKVFSVPEIKNGVRLSNTLSEAFNLPFISLDEFKSKGSFTYNLSETSTIYEMVCRQELIKKELLESKHNFQSIWATEDSFNELASYLYKDDETVMESLAKAIKEIPFLALTTKKQLSESITNSNKFIGVSVSEKDSKKFASRLFEMKKPIRTALVQTLSEKYGINLQNLKEVPSFQNLLRTQIVIFESLSKLSPKNSVQRKTLSEVATMLKEKDGAESIDVNDYLYSLFNEAKYDGMLTENLMNYMDFARVADDLGQIGDILRMLKQGMDGPAPMPGQGQEGEMMGASPEPGMGPQPDMPIPGQEEQMPGEEPMVQPDGEEAQLAADEAGAEFDADVDDMTGGGEEKMELDPSVDPSGEEEMMDGEEEGIPGEEEMMGDEESSGQAEIQRNIAELEDLLADLTAELGGAQEEYEDDMGSEIPEEGEEEIPEDGDVGDPSEEEAEEIGDVDNDGESDIPKKKKKPDMPKEI